MMLRPAVALFVTALVCGCSSTPLHYEPDMIDVTLPVPTDQVRMAVAEVLRGSGYDVEWKDEQTLTSDYRDETRGPWNWLLHWRFGTVKSRVEATVTPWTDDTTRLRLHILSKGKDGIFRRWEPAHVGLPQTAENHLRLIKNALQLL
jgi:hypothetical protein